MGAGEMRAQWTPGNPQAGKSAVPEGRARAERSMGRETRFRQIEDLSNSGAVCLGETKTTDVFTPRQCCHQGIWEQACWDPLGVISAAKNKRWAEQTHHPLELTTPLKKVASHARPWHWRRPRLSPQSCKRICREHHTYLLTLQVKEPAQLPHQRGQN